MPLFVGKSGFGARVHSAISLLTTKFRNSKSQAKKLLHSLYGLPMSVGSVSNIEQRTSLATRTTYEEVEQTFKEVKGPVNIDETGFKQNHANGWAWVMANEQNTLFYLSRSRGKKVAKSLLGDFNLKVIISDRYPVYNYLPENNHQVCWAHLKRDFYRIYQRTGISSIIGRRLLHSYGHIFAFWKSLSGTNFPDNKKVRKKRRHLKNVLTRHLINGSKCGHKQTERTCQNILNQGESLWLFLSSPIIPATNNLAERQLRPLVIAKKLSFGVKSERGARFIERMFTLITTCSQQKRESLEFIQKAISCKTSYSI